MKLSVERKPESLVVLDITADEEEFAHGLDHAFRKVGRDVQIPGFRKGKAPKALMERYYGREYFLREAADHVMDNLYRDALKQEALVPVGEPVVEIVELEPVQFVVTVPVYPTAELGDYSSVRVDPIDAMTSDDDVQEVIDRLQRAQSPWVEVTEARKPVDGDRATVDYEVHEGDVEFQPPVKNALFVLGETNLLTQLSEKIKQINVGESDSFELVFKDDDETADLSIRGKQLRYDVTLKALNARKLVEIDDEFAKKVAGDETVAQLRETIFEDIHQRKTADGRNKVLNSIIEQIAERSTVDLPQAMIHEEAHRQLSRMEQEMARGGTPFDAYLRMQNKTEEDAAVELEPDAAIRLRNSILLQEFAKVEQVEVTDQDIDDEIASITGGVPATDDEAVREYYERIMTIYRSDYFRNSLKTELLDRKLKDRLIEIATEGKGAVLNGWIMPEPDVSAGSELTQEANAELPATTADDSATSNELGPAEGEGTTWVAGDGENTVPDGFPVKGDASSRIFHTPESPFYERNVAEVYFATADNAEAAGYRLRQAGEDAAEEDTDLAEKTTSAE